MAVTIPYFSMTKAVAAAVEDIVNTALEYDPASKREISELTDTLAIAVTPATSMPIPNTKLFITGAKHGLRVMNHAISPVTTCLTGSPTALLNLLQRPHSLANSGVELSGDVNLLQRWQAILDNLDIDWQTCLQRYLGDIGGPITAMAIGHTGHWLQHQYHYHRHQLSVYLQEELRAVPTSAELDYFHRQVDELMLSTDRLEMRVRRLHVQLSGD